MDDTPRDTEGSQLAGRLMAIEVMITRLISDRADWAAFLDRADVDIDRYESAIRTQAPQAGEYLVNMAEAARMAIDEVRYQIRRRK